MSSHQEVAPGGILRRLGQMVLVAGAAIAALTLLSNSATAMAGRAETQVRLHPDQPPLSPYVLDLVREQGGASVPVLVPDWLTKTEDLAKAHDFRLKITAGGYTALMSEAGRDIVITGAGGKLSEKINHFVKAIMRDKTREIALGHQFGPDAIPEDLDYFGGYSVSDEDGGASISFGFAGFDYHVAFYCRDAVRDANGTCIGEDEVEAFALALAGF